MALEHHLTMRKQAQRGSITCPKSMNLSFQFEPDVNIYILDDAPEVLRLHGLDASSMDHHMVLVIHKIRSAEHSLVKLI